MACVLGAERPRKKGRYKPCRFLGAQHKSCSAIRCALTLSAADARLERRSSCALRCSAAHSGQVAVVSPTSPKVRRLKEWPHRKWTVAGWLESWRCYHKGAWAGWVGRPEGRPV